MSLAVTDATDLQLIMVARRDVPIAQETAASLFRVALALSISSRVWLGIHIYMVTNADAKPGHKTVVCASARSAC